MYLNEHLLNRLVEDRSRELAREAKRAHLASTGSVGFRLRLARTLVALGERLEPRHSNGNPVVRL